MVLLLTAWRYWRIVIWYQAGVNPNHSQASNSTQGRRPKMINLVLSICKLMVVQSIRRVIG